MLVIVLLLIGWLWPAPVQAQQLWSGILEPTRAIDWTVTGVQGGIPARSTICATIDPYTGSAAAINSAIASCPAGQVVKLNAGTFVLSSPISWGGRSFVTLRGAGAQSTTVQFSGTTTCFYGTANVCMSNPNFPYADSGGPTNGGQALNVTLVDWTAGYAQGTTVVTVSNGSVVPGAGGMVFLDQQAETADPSNDTTPFVTCSDPWKIGVCNSGRGVGRGVHEGHRVVSKSGNQITITPPLAFTNFRAAMTPQMWWISGTTFEGSSLEDMTVENLGTDTLHFSIVQVRGCIGCWVKNVRSIKSGRAHVGIFESMFVTVESGYQYGSVNTNGASTTYGVECVQCYFSRIQNNIGQSITAPYIMNGGVGNVIGYNYGIRSIYDEAGPNAQFMLQHIFPSHAASAGLNLVEGNEANGVNLDLAHGTSALMTVFRNRFLGMNPGLSDNQNTVAFANIAFVRQTNAVGNVLGTSGYHTNYESSRGPQGVQGMSNVSVYYLGWPGSGEQLTGPGYDSRVASSMLRWKNCDYATNTCRSLTAEVPAGHLTPSSALPPSFYMVSKPSWFGSVAWPPIGPDVTGGADPRGWAKHIPAEVCYRTVMGGPSDGTGAVLPFNPTTCYGGVSSDTTPPAAPKGITVK